MKARNISVHQTASFFHQRYLSTFLTFAGQNHHCGVSQANVSQCEIHKFLNPCTGIISHIDATSESVTIHWKI